MASDRKKVGMKSSQTILLAMCAAWCLASPAVARELSVPEGFSIELIAGPPLVDRPITAALDDKGRLYVGDSSGSNVKMDQQLEEKTHRIMRLVDTDDDGFFDESTVFADRMMFPEGTLFYKGSLYVAAPPSIWKLTDTNDDGIADQREEWFQGKTLTYCANDLHGPYLGPDGFLYWCKGAFAEQTHRVHGREWSTRAAHIFRCRPDGTGFEPVMTGGMDNPVDVIFSPTGDRFFTSTFLVHPGNGLRDGISRAIYGGVHGKSHGVNDGHPRTGKLMPVQVHMGAAAPCGLERYDFALWGEAYQDNLFACQFNKRKVSRHILQADGAAFRTIDHDFIISDDVDFHPTDVFADADGSLLVVDTGGWYKICCPTSQLEKADVLGGIYRVRKNGSPTLADPRGKQLAWNKATPEQLWDWLEDQRSAVREHATRELVSRRDTASLHKFLEDLANEQEIRLGRDHYGRLSRVWALGQLELPLSQTLIRQLLHHKHPEVRKTAAQMVSLHRDPMAMESLIKMLGHDRPANRRVAAEALGRIGNRTAVPHLLSATSQATDRDLEHSIIYALIELEDTNQLQSVLGWSEVESDTAAAALIALDQIAGDHLKSGQVIPYLDSLDAVLKQTSQWLITQHPEWGGDLAKWFRQKLAAVANFEPVRSEQADREDFLTNLLADFASQASVQELMAHIVADDQFSVGGRATVLRAMKQAKPAETPSAWWDVLANVISQRKAPLLELAVVVTQELPASKETHQQLDAALLAVVDNVDARIQTPRTTRVQALSIVASRLTELSQTQFSLLVHSFSDDSPISVRQPASEAIAGARLSGEQLRQVCALMRVASPLEVNLLLEPFVHSADETIGLQLIAALKRSSALPALRVEILRDKMAKYGPSVQEGIEEIHKLLNVNLDAQRAKLAALLPQMENGNERRGHAVFHSSKALCSACHKLGYAGGITGPDLSRIGATRTKRDLLESILFPSLSFVRNYEPVIVVTETGQMVNGLIRNESATDILLATGPNKEFRVLKDEIEDITPSRMSIMPAGLDKQLTIQQLADLVAFLKSRGE